MPLMAPAPPRNDDMDDPAWTIEDACRYFAAGGLPVAPERLTGVIRELGVKPAGEARPARPQGGRGKATYPLGELMRAHAFIVEYDARQGCVGTGPPTDPFPVT